jgi:D-glycero-D-manno-heptose 1,7-bisphosphate phosphatase
MVLQAAQDLALDLARSYFIGDKDSDMQCGRRAGTRTVLVETGYGKSAPQTNADHVVPDLPAAAQFILTR